MLQLPFIVLLQQHGADHPDDRGLIWEYPHDIGAPFHLLVQPLQRVRNWYEDRGACSSG
jgi:hypothetical protein